MWKSFAVSKRFYSRYLNARHCSIFFMLHNLAKLDKSQTVSSFKKLSAQASHMDY